MEDKRNGLIATFAELGWNSDWKVKVIVPIKQHNWCSILVFLQISLKHLEQLLQYIYVNMFQCYRKNGKKSKVVGAPSTEAIKSDQKR